jgi:hypothetical protein
LRIRKEVHRIVAGRVFVVGAACTACLALPVAASAQIDLSGGWATPQHEDAPERGEAWSASLWTVPEHQCIPHAADYGPNFSSLRIWADVDPVTSDTVAYHTQMAWMTPVRTIWMDGRPHPSAYAPHTWQGFSTGTWEGDMLTVTTTHLKPAYIRRNGLARSEKATLTEHFIRSGDVLTWIQIIDNPVYLAEPFIRYPIRSNVWIFAASRYMSCSRTNTGWPKTRLRFGWRSFVTYRSSRRRGTAIRASSWRAPLPPRGSRGDTRCSCPVSPKSSPTCVRASVWGFCHRVRYRGRCPRMSARGCSPPTALSVSVTLIGRAGRHMSPAASSFWSLVLEQLKSPQRKVGVPVGDVARLRRRRV